MHFPILQKTMEGFVKVKTIIDAFNLSFWNFSNNGTCKLCIYSILRFNVQRETTWMIGVMILENSFVGLLTLHLTQFTTGGCHRNSLITWFLGGWRFTSKKIHDPKVQDRIWTSFGSWIPCERRLWINRVDY